MNKPLEQPGLQVRDIHHWIAGKEVAGTSGRFGDVYNPALGAVSGRVAFASTEEVGQAIAAAQAAFPAWAATPPLRRARVIFKFKELIERDLEKLARPDLQRARQSRVRRARGSHARPGSGRVRLRHSASAQGRVQRAGRHRRGQLLDAPAAGRVRRHHAVQLPGDGADVDVPDRDRLRQHLRPQAFRARSVGRPLPCEAAAGSRAAGRRVQRRPRRQGRGRCAADRSAHRGGELRRLHADRRVHLPDRHRAAASACRRSAARRTTWW